MKPNSAADVQRRPRLGPRGLLALFVFVGLVLLALLFLAKYRNHLNPVHGQATRSTHKVLLTWNPSISKTAIGYHIYRSTIKGKNYTRITSTPVKGVSLTDPSVRGGQTYYYVATAVDASGNESHYSEEIQVAIP